MKKGKFWAVMRGSDQKFWFYDSQWEAEANAQELARMNLHQQFIVLESHHGYLVDSPVKKIEPSGVMVGGVEF